MYSSHRKSHAQKSLQNVKLNFYVVNFAFCVKVLDKRTRKATQLNVCNNFIIVCIIWNDIVGLFTNPLNNIKIVQSKIDNYFIMILHIYHFFIVNQLTYMDYFHHILFVGGGVLPTILYYDCNLVRLGWLSSCGIPGCIEYMCLSLVKHEKMDTLKQKRLNSYIYNYIRYPITVFCPTLTFIAYNEGVLQDTNKFILIYINLILFFP